jgi:uncharacterized membrane protein
MRCGVRAGAFSGARDMITWTNAAPTVLASFMASLVEFVEALTVVLAVGAVRGWRPALTGTAAAVTLLLLLVGIFGQSITRIPLPTVQLVVGTLLLMFGLRWLRKAILRYAGVIALHDEEAAYAKEAESLRALAVPIVKQWDKIAFVTAFKIVMLEGIEVVFIVIALGAGGRLIMPASLGAIGALMLVVLLGLWLHRPLGRIPENALKFGVGVMLAAFGTFWLGEGVHLQWPDADWSLMILIVAYFLVAQALVVICRSVRVPKAQLIKKNPAGNRRTLWVAVLDDLVALFVDDGRLALGILGWAVIVWFSSGRLPLEMLAQCGLFFAGFSALLGYSALRAARS